SSVPSHRRRTTRPVRSVRRRPPRTSVRRVTSTSSSGATGPTAWRGTRSARTDGGIGDAVTGRSGAWAPGDPAAGTGGGTAGGRGHGDGRDLPEQPVEARGRRVLGRPHARGVRAEGEVDDECAGRLVVPALAAPARVEERRGEDHQLTHPGDERPGRDDERAEQGPAQPDRRAAL